MAKHVESAKVFFEALDCGRGHDLLAAHATPDASFECAALPMKTLEEYAIFMKVPHPSQCARREPDISYPCRRWPP